LSLDKNSNSITIPQKYLDKIVKMQQDQDKAREQEYQLLRQHLDQMNVLLDQLIKVSGSGSTIAATKKLIPFQTGSQGVGQLLIPPANPDDYPTRIDVYKINDNRTVPHMTLINDGPGDIFFISSYSNNQFNTREEHLNVNDQRELFNVYEVRLRSTLPTTTIRLIEGIFRTGSTAPQTKINVEVRPTLQTNEIRVEFDALFDNVVPTITITSPVVDTLIPNYIIPTFQAPLLPGATATLVDLATGLAMPFTVPEGFIIEFFSIFGNLSTDNTTRFYIELIPGEFTLFTVLPASNRGVTFNLVLNVNQFNTQGIDPLGAPLGGRRVLATITNDDPFNNMIGDYNISTILRRIT